MPIFYYTRVEWGGYGFSSTQIAMFLGLGGLAQSIWLLLVFPRLHWHIGTGGVLRLCASVWPVWFVAMPATNYLLRLGLETTFWTFTPFLLVVGSGVAMAFSKSFPSTIFQLKAMSSDIRNLTLATFFVNSCLPTCDK